MRVVKAMMGLSWMVLALLTDVSCATRPAVPGRDAELVKDGAAKCAIVLSAQAGLVERHAADELKTYLQKITGADVAITAEAAPGVTPIRIGVAGADNLVMNRDLKKAVAAITDDGFVIESGKDGVQIVAKDKRGLLYGVYHLLKSYGGVYWLFPGEEGEYCPKNNAFVVPAQCTTVNPAFTERKFRLNGGSGWTPDTFDWLLRNGLQVYGAKYKDGSPEKKYMDERAMIINVSDELTPIMVGAWDKKKLQALFDEHPEYFGIYKGKRGVYGVSQPCTSNSEVIKLMLEHWLQKLEAYGQVPLVAGCGNDDHTCWCQCDNCKKLDPPEEVATGDVSTRWWLYVNAVAKAILTPDYPNRSMAVLVYQNYRRVPVGVKPDPRVTAIICPHQRCYIHPLDDPTCAPNASKFRKMFEDWHAAGIRSTTFEYHPEMPGKCSYLPMEASWVKDLQFYKRLNMYGFGMVVTAPDGHYAGHEYGRTHLYALTNQWRALWQQHWLTGYFAWNIDADFETVSEAINSRYYGPAWPAMKAYRAELLKAIQETPVNMGYGTPNAVLGKCYDRPGLAQRLADLLDQAEKAVAQDPVILKRVKYDREYLKTNWEAAYEEYQQTKQKEYNARRTTQAPVIDGILDDPDWKNSDFVTDFIVFGEDGRKAEVQTFVRMLYDDTNVYFGIECLKAKSGKVEVKAAKDGLDALNGSHLELFLTPPGLGGKYYHIGFSTNGKLYQAMTDSPSSRDADFKLNPQVKMTELPDRWIAEVKVPIEKLKGKIADGDVWRINVARCALTDAGKAESSSWSGGGVFHGSEVHRSVAFGAEGAIVKNGDMEDCGKPRLDKNPARNWEYLSADVPLHWSFNENNRGKAELVSTGAPFGRHFLRLQGTNAFVEQVIAIPAGATDTFGVNLVARGKGELCLSLRDATGKYHNSIIKKFDTDKWETISGLLQCDVPGRTVLALRITGEIDLDNIRMSAETSLANMPDAEKSK